jgi:CxxC-x17-CxxC domain-containing protein
MFEAVCDKCHQTCEVPFRPTGDKPVYCNDCFGSGSRSEKSAGSDQNKKQFDMLNAKLDTILEILSGKKATVKSAKEVMPIIIESKPAKTEAKPAKAPKKEKAVKKEKAPAKAKKVAKKK